MPEDNSIGPPEPVVSAPASTSIEAELERVDFFARLGFYDEARAKLDDLAGKYPGDPSIALRYQQLP